MKKHLLYSLLFTVFFFLNCCKEFLDIVPENDIETIETNFEKREDALAWLKSCYVMLDIYVGNSINNPAYFGADEFCGGDYARISTHGVLNNLKIGDGLQMAQTPYANVWHKQIHYAAIRYCNIFLENIDHVYNMDSDEKKIWAAEVKAIKAFYYFDLMRRYGPIILIDKNTPPNVSITAMQQTRRPINECVEAIVKLCNEVIPILPSMNNKTEEHKLFFNKEAAATLKALTLLYAASPLFNGNIIFKNFVNKENEQLFPDYDKEKWKRAAIACDSAILFCQEAGKKLVSGSNNMPTPLLNIMQDIEHTWIGKEYDYQEAILVINNLSDKSKYFTLVKADVNATKYHDETSQGCLGAPMKMVEMFYTDHGLPIEEDRQWVGVKYAFSKEANEKYKYVIPMNETILNLHRRREPRFYAMIAADRTLWYRMSTSTSGINTYEALPVNCRQGEEIGSTVKRFDETVPQNLTGYWIKKGLSSSIPFPRYLHTYSFQNPRYIFRLAELYLAAAEAWNEYEGPCEKAYNYIDKVRKRAGILNVREAWTSYAKNPNKVTTQTGLREIIHREWNIEFAFEGRRYWNLRRWMTAEKELNTPQYGWNVLSSTKEGFYCQFNGGQPIIVWKKCKFKAPRDYFTPIRAEEILISGIVQNPDW